MVNVIIGVTIVLAIAGIIFALNKYKLTPIEPNLLEGDSNG